jgi:CRP-like cAMP-binding protein
MGFFGAAAYDPGHMKHRFLPRTLETLLPAQIHPLCVAAFFKKQERLFLKGKMPEWMFFVIAGEVTLERTGLRGEPVILQRTRLGFVSEASLLVAKYHCDAVAVSETRAIKVPVKAIACTLDHDPQFAGRWIRMLNGEVKRLRLQCERLSMKSAKDRVLHLINTEGANGAYRVHTGLKSLASELGITHEALYRTLSTLEQTGVIQRDEGLLTLCTRSEEPGRQHSVRSSYSVRSSL